MDKKSPKVKKTYAYPLVALAIGLLFTTLGVVMLVGSIVFSATSTPTTATVVAAEQHSTSSKGCPHTELTVDFTTTQGKKVTAVADNKAYCTLPAKGSSVKIAYTNSNPSSIQVRNSEGSWAIPTFALIVGVLFLWGSTTSLRSTYKNNRALQS